MSEFVTKEQLQVFHQIIDRMFTLQNLGNDKILEALQGLLDYSEELEERITKLENK